PKEVSIHTEFVTALRQSDAGEPPVELNAREFVAKLMEYRRLFQHKVHGSKIALMKLQPTREDKLDAPWEGTGQLRIWGESDPGKPAEVIVYLRYQTVRPTTEAMAAGKWLLRCAITQSQIGHSDHFLMREVGAARGLEVQRLHDNWASKQNSPATGGV